MHSAVFIVKNAACNDRVKVALANALRLETLAESEDELCIVAYPVLNTGVNEKDAEAIRRLRERNARVVVVVRSFGALEFNAEEYAPYECPVVGPFRHSEDGGLIEVSEEVIRQFYDN